MSDQFIGEIRMFGCNFAPKNWASCDGQLMAISQNTALFSLLGTFYGGNGSSTFALPNLQGSAPVHSGQGPGLSIYDLGQAGGEEFVTLVVSEMPFHTHQASASASTANLNSPNPLRSMARTRGGVGYHAVPATGAMSPQTIGVVGSSFPHNNMMPYLTIGFCIALQGIFPARP